MEFSSFVDFPVTTKLFLALLLCPCSREHISELSPLNSIPAPWLLPYRVFGTSKAQARADVSRRGEGDCTLQPVWDHLALQSHDLFLKFWEVNKIRFCSHSRGWSWCPLPRNSFVLSHGSSSMLTSRAAWERTWLLDVTGMLQISHTYTYVVRKGAELKNFEVSFQIWGWLCSTFLLFKKNSCSACSCFSSIPVSLQPHV